MYCVYCGIKCCTGTCLVFVCLPYLNRASAYFGLFDILEPKEGQTLVVSGAAGAVGSIVGQLGKIKGCHVVGEFGPTCVNCETVQLVCVASCHRICWQ